MEQVETDRLAGLPPEMQEMVFDYLGPGDLAKVSLLSKAWQAKVAARETWPMCGARISPVCNYGVDASWHGRWKWLVPPADYLVKAGVALVGFGGLWLTAMVKSRHDFSGAVRVLSSVARRGIHWPRRWGDLAFMTLEGLIIAVELGPLLAGALGLILMAIGKGTRTYIEYYNPDNAYSQIDWPNVQFRELDRTVDWKRVSRLGLTAKAIGSSPSEAAAQGRGQQVMAKCLFLHSQRAQLREQQDYHPGARLRGEILLELDYEHAKYRERALAAGRVKPSYNDFLAQGHGPLNARLQALKCYKKFWDKAEVVGRYDWSQYGVEARWYQKWSNRPVQTWTYNAVFYGVMGMGITLYSITGLVLLVKVLDRVHKFGFLAFFSAFLGTIGLLAWAPFHARHSVLQRLTRLATAMSNRADGYIQQYNPQTRFPSVNWDTDRLSAIVEKEVDFSQALRSGLLPRYVLEMAVVGADEITRIKSEELRLGQQEIKIKEVDEQFERARTLLAD